MVDFLRNINFEHIGYKIIEEVDDGSSIVKLLNTDFKTGIDLNHVDLEYNNICPQCMRNLTEGMGANGEPYVACKACGYYSE